MIALTNTDRAELVKALTNAADALDYSISRFEGHHAMDRKVVVTLNATRALIRKHSVPRSRIDAIAGRTASEATMAPMLAGLGTSGMRGMDR